jgi:hypothetical protein
MSKFIITIGTDSVRACVGMDRAMSEPQYVFGGAHEAEAAKSVFAKNMAENNARFNEQFWLNNLTILASNGQTPWLACPYVRVVDGHIVDF